jgi:hypothetical protein
MTLFFGLLLQFAGLAVVLRLLHRPMLRGIWEGDSTHPGV